jgi:hypothetical protein
MRELIVRDERALRRPDATGVSLTPASRRHELLLRPS